MIKSECGAPFRITLRGQGDSLHEVKAKVLKGLQRVSLPLIPSRVRFKKKKCFSKKGFTGFTGVAHAGEK